MKNRRGFLLVVSLLFVIMLLLLGMGFLGSQAARHRASKRSAEMAQARALALAGLEDARAKLENDLRFPPPPSGPSQNEFSYSEKLPLPDGTDGTYSVLIDRSYEGAPWEVLEVTSTGSIGPPETPTAQYSFKAELDVATFVRGTANPNPELFNYTHIEDMSSL